MTANQRAAYDWAKAHPDYRSIAAGHSRELAGEKMLKTRGDRIRAMPDEELAKRLWRKLGCPAVKNYVTCGYMGNCKDHWLDWLQQPAEESE